MPHHPPLSEVLEEECSHEWLDLRPEGLTIRDWVDAENAEGDRCNMQFFLLCGAATSEFGNYEFPKVDLNIYSVEEEKIQTLEGKFPLGSINFYEESCPTINVNLSKSLVAHLLPFIATNLSGFRVRVSVPKWQDDSAKCLPLMSYQVFYEQEVKI